jgi:hypothetical protein
MTRPEYESAVAEMRASEWGTFTERVQRARLGRTAYFYAALDRRCDYKDAALVGAVMANLAAKTRGYLTCHTCNGLMEFSVAVSRDVEAGEAVTDEAYA